MLIALISLIACGGPSAPTIPLTINGHTIAAEIADTKEEREQGLMDRPSMPADHGMLFVYEDVKPRGFWMKNTLIPLDIAFADRDGVIVKIEQMQPHDRRSTKSIYPAMYALEMNEGWFEAHGVAKGAVIEGLPDGPEAAPQAP